MFCVLIIGVFEQFVVRRFGPRVESFGVLRLVHDLHVAYGSLPSQVEI